MGTASALVGMMLAGASAAWGQDGTWTIGAPIVHYWAGPGYPGAAPLDDAAAKRLATGGWNLVWCRENELDVAQRHGLRAMLTDPLLTAAAAEGGLATAEQRDALAALVARVRSHPALYAYHLRDEPGAALFPQLGKAVAFLREHDPGRLAYINLFPTYATNEQLGTTGDTATAYREHLRRFVAEVRPGLLSYDHYQFMNGGDNPQYFLNLALVREEALRAGVPFLNIVQASDWVAPEAKSAATPRVPDAEELRYLVYTTLAYGGQGISYYVYCYPRHAGGIEHPDGTPTPLYDALKVLNREFVAIAGELQPLASRGVFHAGMRPPGAVPLPDDAPFRLDPPVPDVAYEPGRRVEGVLLGWFGADAKGARTHVLVVNLDYRNERTVGLRLGRPADRFDAATRRWTPLDGKRIELTLPGGAGQLVRVRP